MENPKLKPELYWEWRATIAEMQVAEEQHRFARLQHDGMIKDHEIARLKAAIFRGTIQNLEEKKNLCKTEYENLKSRIEKELGTSLNNKVIDDITFEVRDLEEPVNS